MRKILLFVGLFMALNAMHAQKHYITNQYVYDLFQMNPAAAAYQKNCISANAFYQKQWFGTEMAPTTQILSFQAPLEEKLGSGTYIYNDQNGLMNEIGLNQAFSYEILVQKNRRRFTTLTFGISFLLEQISINQNSLIENGAFDPIMQGGKEAGFGFNASTGMLLKHNNSHFGIGITNLFPRNNPLYSSFEEPVNFMDFHLHVGGSYNVPGRDLILEPLFLFRRNMQSSSQMDMNVKLTMPTPNPDLSTWGLLAYRHVLDDKFGKSNGMAITGGIAYANISAGIEYQLGLTSAQIDYGSAYQLILGYRFCHNKRKGAIPCSKIRQSRKYNYKFVGF